MTSKEKLHQIFEESLNSCERLAARLKWSQKQCSLWFPLHSQVLEELDEERAERLDAFCLRFGKLQDLLGQQLFRSLLILEQDPLNTMLDTLHAMEKRGILETLDLWFEIRELRNILSHDYPESTALQAQVLNRAFDSSTCLIMIPSKVRNYAQRKQLLLKKNYDCNDL